MGAHLERARILIRQRRYDLARDALREELSLTPDDATAHALLSICFANLQDLQSAREEADSAVRLAPDESFPYAGLTFVLRIQGLLQEAEKAIQEAIRLNPRQPDYYDELATIYLDLDKLTIRLDRTQRKKALRAALQGLSVDPTHVGCLNSFALANFHLEKFAEARKAISTARSLAPEDPRTIHNHGLILTGVDDFHGAVATLQEARRVDPSNESVHETYRTALSNWFGMYVFFSFIVTLLFYVVLAIGMSRMGRGIPRLSFIPGITLFFILYSSVTSCLTPFYACVAFRWLPGRPVSLSARQIQASNCIVMFTLAALFVCVIDLIAGNASVGCTSSFFLVPLSWPVAASISCPSWWLRVLLVAIVGWLVFYTFQEVRVFHENSILDCGNSFKLVFAISILSSWLPRWAQLLFGQRAFEAPFPQ